MLEKSGAAVQDPGIRHAEYHSFSLATESSPQAARTTLKQALQRYLREVTPGKKGRALEARRVKSWMQHPLAQRRLCELRAADFVHYRNEELARGKPANAVRLELALIRVLYKVASREWGASDLENPITDVTPSSSARERRLAGDEEKRLLAQLKASGAYFAPLAELALESAMRQAELLALTAADVDFENRIANVRETPDGKTRTVPLSPRATEIIRALPQPKSLVAPLFPVPRDSLIRSFRKACDDAGIRDLSFHDLRHEAIARICARLPMHRAMRVVGYKTPAMLMRYYEGLPPQPEPPALAADKNMRILVVEDDRDSAEMLQKLLELCGYSVAVAYSSKEGLEAAAKTPPDVVLCDIRLPDSDGYAFAEALRGNPKTARARLIAVTGYGGVQDRKRSREAGFQLHLVKPVKPENLLQELAQPVVVHPATRE
jgi:CheY-like chemotaxis protein